VVAVLALAPLRLPAADSPAKEDCLDCHGDKTLSKTNAAGAALSLFVDQSLFLKSP
jgi:hypothetical protein